VSAPGHSIHRVGLARKLWIAGWPARSILLAGIRGYRATLSKLTPGRCRFHPSCSAYAERAVAELGAARGVVLAVWRVLRCSPLSAGGVDHPPVHRRAYEDVIPGKTA
jgi:putative membrane protein insertion efficiency factor